MTSLRRELRQNVIRPPLSTIPLTVRRDPYLVPQRRHPRPLGIHFHILGIEAEPYYRTRITVVYGTGRLQIAPRAPGTNDLRRRSPGPPTPVRQACGGLQSQTMRSENACRADLPPVLSQRIHTVFVGPRLHVLRVSRRTTPADCMPRLAGRFIRGRQLREHRDAMDGDAQDDKVARGTVARQR